MIVIFACLVCIIFSIIFVLFLYDQYNKRDIIEPLWNLPVVGLLPAVLGQFEQLQDRTVSILGNSPNGTVLLKGGWLAQKDILGTSNPEDVRHIMSEHISKYPKGSEWRKRFDIFGNHSVFTTDYDEWKHHRKVARAFLSHLQFHQLMAKVVPDVIQNGIIPVLDDIAARDAEVDLQSVFRRLTFDVGSIIATGYHPKSLSVGGSESPFSKAMDDTLQTILVRHLLPESIWRFQRWLGIGNERKLRESWETVNHFISQQMGQKRERLHRKDSTQNDYESYNLLSCYLTGHEVTGPTPSDEVMRDNVLTFIFGTEDSSSTTLSWFFWLLTKNPSVEIKIKQELERNLPTTKEEVTNWLLFNFENLDKLVYLHGALCETLRLHPPIPFQVRIPTEPDILPSGHHVNQNTNIIISLYSMARMKSVWGKDCNEFKPERWITEDGKIKHEPPHKFPAFNAGPRICPGKDIALTLMKAVVATIIQNYQIQVLENQNITPKVSIFSILKHGLMAKVKTRRTL